MTRTTSQNNALYLGVDMGTSSTKATLINKEGKVLSRATFPSSVSNPREGFFEVDAELVWWKNFLLVCQKFFSEINAASLKALCVSSVCGSFVPVDAQFRALHGAILYGIDRRSEAIVNELNARWGASFLKARLGNIFSTHSILPKILWLKRNRPDVYSRSAHFVSSFNFIGAKLTGSPMWDIPTAYGALMIDSETETVPDWFLDDCGLDAGKIPPIADAVTQLGTVSASAAKETGIPEGTVVMLGACDINAEAMASDAVRPGSALAVFGSTTSLLLNTPAPCSLDGFTLGRSLLPGVWRVGAATASGGHTCEWARGLSDSRDESGAPTGIIFIPWLDGARTPFNNPSARGAFLGLKSSHTARDMALAVRESLGYELSFLVSKMSAAAPFPEVLDVSGGLSNIPSLMQMVSDITERPLRLHNNVDASYGDAKIALMSSVPYESQTPREDDTTTVTPGADGARYREEKNRFAELSEMLGHR